MNSPDSRLADFVAALSLACDLGNNFPLEKGLRNTVLAVRLGRVLGLRDEALAATYYVSLLRFVGCSAYSHETARSFPDDNAMREAMAPVDFAFPAEVIRGASRLGRSPMGRAKAVARFAARGKSIGAAMTRADCEVMVQTAGRLGMPAAVAVGLADVYERWDGKGQPRGKRGAEIALPARILQVAHEAEIHHRLGGRAAAGRVVARGSGGWFDPEIAAAFLARADELLELIDQPSVWDLALDEEPSPRLRVPATRLADMAAAFGAITDLKSSFFLGHSDGVAQLAEAAAKLLGLAEPDLADLRLAALLHDVGRLSVPTGIWDKPGPLTSAEWERVRLHAYYTERVLTRSPLLARSGEIAALHHERLDGSGYHRAAPATSQSAAARLLAACDVYQALTEPRPHRPARSPEKAAEELLRLAQEGKLDRDAVRAVCRAAGHRVRKRDAGWPAGLSEREVEVLRHLARGASEKEIAKALFVSASTVHTHVAHIYAKIGRSTRAGAALFAMENDLL